MSADFDPIDRAERLWLERWGHGSAHRPMAVATSIMRVQQLLQGEFDSLAARHGLSFARYEALVLLAFSRSGSLPMKTIGERLMVHPTSATSIIQRLAAQGYVERTPNPSDRRGTLASITERGREVMEAVTGLLEEAGFGLDSLDVGEQDALFTLLRRVRLGAGDFAEQPSDSTADSTADLCADPAPGSFPGSRS